jgi:hypothetical protein
MSGPIELLQLAPVSQHQTEMGVEFGDVATGNFKLALTWGENERVVVIDVSAGEQLEPVKINAERLAAMRRRLSGLQSHSRPIPDPPPSRQAIYELVNCRIVDGVQVLPMSVFPSRPRCRIGTLHRHDARSRQC